MTVIHFWCEEHICIINNFSHKIEIFAHSAPTPKKAEETDANIGNKRKKMGPFYPATCPLLNKLE